MLLILPDLHNLTHDRRLDKCTVWCLAFRPSDSCLTVINSTTMNDHEHDEMLLFHNPKGGRPQKIGKLIWKGPDQHEINQIREESQIRFFLGYCPGCGIKNVIGQRRAEVLFKALKRQGITEPKIKMPFKQKIAELILGEELHKDIHRQPA